MSGRQYTMMDYPRISSPSGSGFSMMQFLLGAALGFALGSIVGIMWWEGRNEAQKDKFRREVDNTLDTLQNKLQSLKMSR
ncbi:unnamed protein product [Notodromas monacha]|uniref:Uncharacterized protein n=1 Tax=Notodromas monacha TaxID=399045 RepID=A0A7R9C4T2_9CRUS|nr:unnamed protein product [Notodromas monacha]CAD7285577.1 unnamed protein product [Notodromas monacha]CAG0925270.1 unnamed protein product [Notodromas monacha]CAG0925729.1 unnamed protein product [Notodromas monacha]